MSRFCWCLCQMNHPRQPGICTSENELELLFQLKPSVAEFMYGDGEPHQVAVPYCFPCTVAFLAARRDAQRKAAA